MTNARFAVDAEADPSYAPPEQLHPRLLLQSAAATVEPDKFAPKHSLIEIVLYPFPFTTKDMATAQRGDKWPLLRKSDALANSNPKGRWGEAIVQLTLNEHFQIQEVRIQVLGLQSYGISLSDRQFQSFRQEYQFDGRKLIFKSKGSHRLDTMPAGVRAFTMNWELNLVIPVFKKKACDAEACKLLSSGQKSRWLVFKVAEFRSIQNSRDGSYSVISGVALSGRLFRLRAVWWTEDKSESPVNCSPSIKKYIDGHTPKEQYRPYVISGQAVGDGTSIVLNSIDTCAPQASDFGVPDENVFH